MSKLEPLALFGGAKTINHPFPPYNPIGDEELEAAVDVVRSGILSEYLGSWHSNFYGGVKVKAFERQCESFFHVKHAVTVNSWTSGLIAAIGAIGIEPGDEVIVSPWTMCASATAILQWNAIPVFADIEPRTFCLDVNSVEKNISPYTKAIMAIDIFGHSANMIKLMDIADKHNLKVISDSAQAPGAFYHGKYAGTLAHIGGYSLNYHKHIHTGEGGILVTNDDELAERAQLIRNHGEAVIEDKGSLHLNNMIGYNFRLGEIECAIGIRQLKKLTRLVSERQTIAKKINEGLKDLYGVQLPIVEDNCTHAYYIYPIILDVDKLGVSRERIANALIAEGLKDLLTSYQNIHLLPMYQKKIAYGTNGFPWNSEICKRDINYKKGICPVAEKLHDENFLGIEMCIHDLTDEDVDLMIHAFRKVWSNLSSI